MGNDDGITVLLTLIVFAFALFVGANCKSCSVGQQQGEQNMRQEAVENNKAKWVPQKDGTTVFEWIE